MEDKFNIINSTLATTTGTTTVGGIAPCMKCGVWGCIGSCINANISPYINIPPYWYPQTVDYDLLATKVAEKLVDMVRPDRVRARARMEKERKELMKKFQKALRELENME